MGLFKKKETKIKIELTNFELYLLRETLPYFPAYGQIDFMGAVHKLMDTHTSNEQIEFRCAYEASAEGNILFYLVKNGYVKMTDTYGEKVVKEKDVPFGIIEKVLVSKTFELTEKGRDLRYRTIQKKKKSVKIVSVSIEIRPKLFYIKVVKPLIKKLKVLKGKLIKQDEKK